MNVLLPLCAGLLILIVASRTYPFYISRLLGVDDSQPTPAHRLADGRDYVPSRTHVVFAHHFAVIAGAGPIVGPTLALAFGYGASWAWIVLGCVLFGAVHDMTSMFVSMREDGRSIAEMANRTLGKGGYLLFVAFLVLILSLINAIFLNLSCKALTADYPLSLLKLASSSTLLHTYPNPQGVMVGRIGGIATTSVLVITLVAPLIGYLIHKRRWPTAPMYVIAAVLCALSVLLGFRWPVFLDADTWRWIMSAYVFVACWIPVWLILQPRDFVNVQLLYAGLLMMVVGVVALGVQGHGMAAPLGNVGEGAQLAGPIWPALFITVACGAISGFHSLACTGTTVKQISRESEVRRIGYNAMILEGVLALLTLVLVGSALPRAEYLAIVFPPGLDGNPILAFSIAMGYMLEQTLRIPTAIGAVLGILVVEGFVVTTLDTAVRLCRYLLEELWTLLLGGRTPALFRNPLFNTALAVGLMLFFASSSTIMAAWRIFGAGNQLIGALAMTVVTVWLLQRGRSFWFTLIPALALATTTFTMLALFLWHNLGVDQVGPLSVSAKEKGPLVGASVVMLILAAGVVGIAVRRVTRELRARRSAVPPENVRADS
jgi:carbon starvation protein